LSPELRFKLGDTAFGLHPSGIFPISLVDYVVPVHLPHLAHFVQPQGFFVLGKE
jgi:hypothetical protein